MSLEENKKAYKALDHPRIREKMSEVMLNMCKRENLAEEDDEIFDLIATTFTPAEQTYMSCCYVGLELKQALNNPTFKMLIQLLRQAEKASKEDNSGRGDEMMDKIREILKD